MNTKPNRPRRLFRARRLGADALVLNEVGRPELPEVTAFINAHQNNFAAGDVTMLEVAHDMTCRYPQGGPCTCVAGPDVRMMRAKP